MPSIGTVVPLYNSAKFLVDLVRSLELQSSPLDEIIFVDDGSVDATLLLLADLIGPKTILRSRVTIIELPKNVGISTALNIGLSHFGSDIVLLSGHDDIWVSNRVASTRLLADRSVAPLLHFGYQTFGLYSKSIKPPSSHFETVLRMTRGNCIGAITVALRLDLIKKDKCRFNSRFDGAEDYDLWADLICEGLTTESQPEMVMQYRISPQQMSRQGVEKVANRVRERYISNLFPGFDEQERAFIKACSSASHESPMKVSGNKAERFINGLLSKLQLNSDPLLVNGFYSYLSNRIKLGVQNGSILVS
jgi:glycosyltransferase involved in cell wall biosynthesis